MEVVLIANILVGIGVIVSLIIINKEYGRINSKTY